MAASLSSTTTSPGSHLLALLIGLGIVASFLLVRWWSFRWWIEDDAIWTSGGIFNLWRRRVRSINRDDRPLVHAGAASLRCLQDRDRDDSCRPGSARCPLWLPVEQECKSPRGLADHEARLRWQGEDNEARRFDPLSVDQLGWWDLILAGATTFQIGRALVILYAAILFFQEQMTPRPSIVIGFDVTAFGLSPAQFPIVPFLGIIVVLWLVSTVYFVVSFARFRLGTHGAG